MPKCYTLVLGDSRTGAVIQYSEKSRMEGRNTSYYLRMITCKLRTILLNVKCHLFNKCPSVLGDLRHKLFDLAGFNTQT